MCSVVRRTHPVHARLLGTFRVRMVCRTPHACLLSQSLAVSCRSLGCVPPVPWGPGDRRCPRWAGVTRSRQEPASASAASGTCSCAGPGGAAGAGDGSPGRLELPSGARSLPVRSRSAPGPLPVRRDAAEVPVLPPPPPAAQPGPLPPQARELVSCLWADLGPQRSLGRWEAGAELPNSPLTTATGQALPSERREQPRRDGDEVSLRAGGAGLG